MVGEHGNMVFNDTEKGERVCTNERKSQEMKALLMEVLVQEFRLVVRGGFLPVRGSEKDDMEVR